MNVLISMCLCGVPCRYDGRDVPFEKLVELIDDVTLIPVCPEIMGGLSTPRDPAELINHKVISNQGLDVTKEYDQGAHITLKLAKQLNCDVAILKEYSPSCGVHKIYDGSFQGSKMQGSGVTASLLMKNDIEVFSDETVQDFIDKYIKK